MLAGALKFKLGCNRILKQHSFVFENTESQIACAKFVTGHYNLKFSSILTARNFTASTVSHRVMPNTLYIFRNELLKHYLHTVLSFALSALCFNRPQSAPE